MSCERLISGFKSLRAQGEKSVLWAKDLNDLHCSHVLLRKVKDVKKGRRYSQIHESAIHDVYNYARIMYNDARPVKTHLL